MVAWFLSGVYVIRLRVGKVRHSLPPCVMVAFSDSFACFPGFLNEDCDDTIIELSKLSIADSEHEVTVIENFHDTSNRVSTPRDYVLRRCNQTNAILFDECYPESWVFFCMGILRASGMTLWIIIKKKVLSRSREHGDNVVKHLCIC